MLEKSRNRALAMFARLLSVIQLLLTAIPLYFLHFIRVFRAKMSIAHEKDIEINRNGIYPNFKKLPSPLCCFRIMHIRTGTSWIAYCEIMWIVTQFSFWTAESVVRRAFPPYIIIAGFCFTSLQLLLIICLIHGVRNFRLAFIESYMIGLCCRIFLFLSFLLTLIFFLITTDEAEIEESQSFFHRFLIIKIIFSATYTLLKAFALKTVYRCYSYIARTRRAVKHLIVIDDSECNVQFPSDSHSTFRSMLPSNHKCRHYGCRICSPNPTSTSQCRDVLVKSSSSKQISQIPQLQCSVFNGT